MSTEGVALPWAVYHRAKGGRWRLVERAADAEAARARMFELMGRAGGDWTVSPADRPPRPPRLWGERRTTQE